LVLKHLLLWFTGSHKKGTVKAIAWLDDNTVVTAAEDCTVRQWSVKF